MHPVHRAVFLTGVMSYLSAPLWFMFLALSTALQVVHTLMEPQYFLQPRQLFPVWPQWRPELAIALFSTTLVLLFLPKLLSIVLIWAKGAKEYGGAFRLFISMLMEMLFSVLLAPVRMLFHTVFVVSAFLGWEVVWNSPQRDDDDTPWGEAFRRHGSQMLLGLVWAGGMAWLDLRFLWWLAPIVFSLILSPFVSVLSSRATLGMKSKRAKLFLIPEEVQPAARVAGDGRISASQPQPRADQRLYACGGQPILQRAGDGVGDGASPSACDARSQPRGAGERSAAAGAGETGEGQTSGAAERSGYAGSFAPARLAVAGRRRLA